MHLSIIIKAYNEEEHIAGCIESVLSEAKSVQKQFEIIVSDSGSTDKTRIIAKNYPVNIVKRPASWRKSPSTALYAGWLRAKGDYIYVIDGDMKMKQGSLKQLFKELKKDKTVAGVEGRLEEPPTGNNINARTSKRFREVDLGEVNYLDGGGLYRRSSIEQAGNYLSRPELFAAEESELGYRLVSKGFKLKRIRSITRTHHFYKGKSLAILWNKFTRGYMLGFGQVLRLSITGGYVVSYLKKLSIYLFMLGYLIALVVSALLISLSALPFYILVSLLILFTLFQTLRRKSLSSSVITLFSWTLQAISLVPGFFMIQSKQIDETYRKQ